MDCAAVFPLFSPGYSIAADLLDEATLPIHYMALFCKDVVATPATDRDTVPHWSDTDAFIAHLERGNRKVYDIATRTFRHQLDISAVKHAIWLENTKRHYKEVRARWASAGCGTMPVLGLWGVTRGSCHTSTGAFCSLVGVICRLDGHRAHFFFTLTCSRSPLGHLTFSWHSLYQLSARLWARYKMYIIAALVLLMALVYNMAMKLTPVDVNSRRR